MGQKKEAHEAQGIPVPEIWMFIIFSSILHLFDEICSSG
jgi:hypothetical protein